MRIFRCLTFCLAATGVSAATATLPQLADIPANQPFTFVVLGDNRGDDSGQQPAAFLQVLRAANEAAPSFALNTGDMIYGRTRDEARAREQWRLYREALTQLKSPVFHVPGNHDLWDEPSARLYQELAGPTYYSFDHGRARFIGLDTETNPGRVGPRQFAWLKSQLEESGQRVVFIFLHQPLFPVDGAIGSSLDVHPMERDRLHRLFVRHRRAIKGIFLGHEHLFHFLEQDGVPYYITGGAGAPLYQTADLGGFHHFLLVRVDADKVAVEVKKVGAPARPLLAPRPVASGELLESWEQGLFWQTWNYTVTAEITPNHASEGHRGLQLNFDLAQCPWPVLFLPLPFPWDWRDAEAMSLNVYLPPELKAELTLTPVIEARAKREAPTCHLQPGWNTVRTELNGPWLPAEDRNATQALEWCLAAPTASNLCGWVVFDNLRLERRAATAAPTNQLLEGWERPLLWRVADETVNAVPASQASANGRHGLKLIFDLALCPHPVLFARLNPPWNLGAVSNLTVEAYVPANVPGPLALGLALRAKEVEFRAPPVPLKRGWNHVNIPLTDRWLPKEAQAAAEQVQWHLSSPSKTLRGWILLADFRAGP